tara:strand:+ start:1255 stop:1614 length:360 start_codon:yes stop_codon:yes gene_type:complete
MIAALVLGGALLFGGGLVTGVALNRKSTEKVIAEQTQLIGAIQDGQQELIEAAGKPVVIDAEVRAQLSDVPPACIEDLGGNPRSAECLLLSCYAFGQSSANRPECSPLLKLVMERHELD